LSNYALTGGRWALGSTVTWYYEGTSSAVISHQISAGYPTTDLFPSEIRAAFSRWDDFGAINFQQVSSPIGANIVIRWGNIDGAFNILGQASWNYFANGLFASPVNITFDSSELYNPASGTERLANTSASFYALALHEIGHAIGIAHYSDELAIMNPYISSLNDMTQSDVAAVRALYGTPPPPYDIDWDLNWNLVAVGDFTRDGTTDLVWQNTAGVLGGWVMGNNNRAATLDLPAFEGWTAIGTGDFNGDGTSDILWQNSNGLVGEWFMGSGTRQATANIQAMAGWRVLGTGDFNGDGTSDIIWSNGAGFLGSWLMQGGQIAGTLELPNFDWNLVAMGDFNRDGVTDFLWQNAYGGVGEWLMGGGTRAATFTLPTMTGWTPLGSGDFNGDGTDDVLWRDAGGVTQVWLMNAAQVVSQHGGGYASNWQFRAIGDFNGDRYDDILWQNPVSGDLVIWNMGAGGVVVAMTAEPSNGNEFPSSLGDDTLRFETHATTSIADYVSHYDDAHGFDMQGDVAGNFDFDLVQWMVQRDSLHFTDTSLA
jgi:hypothetical protein